MTVDWELIRNTYFPGIERNQLTYFMAASASPLNKSAHDSVMSYHDDMLNYGDMHFEQITLDIENTREMVAERSSMLQTIMRSPFLVVILRQDERIPPIWTISPSRFSAISAILQPTWASKVSPRFCRGWLEI